jgi:hypothetical protein
MMKLWDSQLLLEKWIILIYKVFVCSLFLLEDFMQMNNKLEILGIFLIKNNLIWYEDVMKLEFKYGVMIIENFYLIFIKYMRYKNIL